MFKSTKELSSVRMSTYLCMYVDERIELEIVEKQTLAEWSSDVVSDCHRGDCSLWVVRSNPARDRCYV
jgi:hypothetical protein